MKKFFSFGVVSCAVAACYGQTVAPGGSQAASGSAPVRDCGVESCSIPEPVSPKVEEYKAVAVDIDQEDISDNNKCPTDMVWVHGQYCEKTDETCIRYDKHQHCAEFRAPVHCLGKTKYMEYCIDRYEYPNKKGIVPTDWMSWNQSKKTCENIGKRLCTDSEWSFAAGGESSLPIPYGDGYHRDVTKCNLERHITGVKIMEVKDPHSQGAEILRSYLVPSGSMPECHSNQFLVFDLAGNTDEFVVNEHGFKDHAPYISGMKGGHIGAVRGQTRAMTTAHSPIFYWYESNTRCCSDAE